MCPGISGDGDGADHAGALVGLAVVLVFAGLGQGPGSTPRRGVDEAGVGDGVSIHARGDLVLVEHDVVGEAGVVLEHDGLAGCDGHVLGDEGEGAAAHRPRS